MCSDLSLLDFKDIESSDLQSVGGPWVSPIRAHPFFNNLQISFESGTEMYYFFLFSAYMQKSDFT